MRSQTFILLSCSTALWACGGLTDTIADLSDAGGLPDDSGTVPIADGGDIAGAEAGTEGADAGDAASTSASALPSCFAEVAAQTFRHALCSCTDTQMVSIFSVDAFNSSAGPYAAASALRRGTLVGVNGALSAISILEIGGSLTVAGGAGVLFTSITTIAEDLRVAKDLTYLSNPSIAGSVWLGGDLISILGELTIAGDLYHPDGAVSTGTITPTIHGREVFENVHVPPPCPCRSDQLIDVAGWVVAGKARAQNNAVGFDPSSVVLMAGERHVSLAAERLFAANLEVASGATLTLDVQKRSALFVEGDVTLAGALRVQLAPDAALDLVIAKDLTLGEGGIINQGRAARLRIYVAGSGAIELPVTAPGSLPAQLYAPHAVVSLPGRRDVEGALFAHALALYAGGAHYDRSILQEGDACKTP